MSAHSGARVLVLTPDFPPSTGGIQLLIRRVVEGLDPKRTRVVTLGVPGAGQFDSGRPPAVVRVGSKGGRLHRASVMRLNSRALVEAARFRPDVVVSGHVVLAPATFAITTFSRAASVQYVYADEFRTRPQLCAFAVRRANAVIAISAYTRELALGAGAPAGKIALITPGVDTRPVPARAPTGRPTIVTVARLVEHKGHDVLIRALPLIRHRVPGVEWVVIGDGPMRSELERLAEEHGVRDCITFTGRLGDEERDEWLARAQVFAMPSRRPPGGVGGEGFGIVFLEAGVSGLPVVGPNVGGPRDVIVEGETGLMVDPTDHAALAEALTRLLLDPELAASLGAAGAGHAREQSWQRHTASVRKLIDGLVEAS